MLEHKAQYIPVESDFPFVDVSRIAEKESWRKEVNRPIYHIHKWWATRLGSVFRAIIISVLNSKRNGSFQINSFYEKHNFANKIVFDPFMGSGTTLGEAIKLGAKAVGNDINPISTFLVKQAFTKVSHKELDMAYRRLEENVSKKIRHYYETIDPDTNEKIVVLYYFWVKVVTTPSGEEIPLFTGYVFSQNAYPNKKPEAQILCPKCWGVFKSRYDSMEVICQNCGIQFNPQSGPVKGSFVYDESGAKYKVKDLIPQGTPLSEKMYALMAIRKNGEKIYLPIKDYDVALYEEAKEILPQLSLPLPSSAVREGYNTNQARGYNYFYWRQFFNCRQLLCLGLLLDEIMNIKSFPVQEQLLCLFSGTLEFNNMFCSFKGEGTGAVRHMFSNHILKPERTPLENSVWGTDKSSGCFSTLYKTRLLKAKEYLDNPFEINILSPNHRGEINGKITCSNPIDVSITDSWEDFSSKQNNMLVLNGDSAEVNIPDGVIDAIITDPPYFDFVHYSELSDFFYAWLSLVLKDRYSYFSKDNSSDNREVQNSDSLTFSRLLTGVFSECNRVLKDDGTLTFSFHHSRSEGWAAIGQSLILSGFEVIETYPVHAELRVSSIKSSTKKPISLDTILICQKSQHRRHNAFMLNHIITKTTQLSTELIDAGLSISQMDKFVIAASQALIYCTGAKQDYTSMQKNLESVYRYYLK